MNDDTEHEPTLKSLNAPGASKPTVKIEGPPAGYTVAGHAFWLLPGTEWALFRPDGRFFFPMADQKKNHDD